MAGRNYFAALLGLAGDDGSPAGSPSAATGAGALRAGAKPARVVAAAAGAASSSSGGASSSTAAGAGGEKQGGGSSGGGGGGAGAGAPAVTAAAGPAGAGADAALRPKPSRPKLKEPLVWIDLEMTGLDLDKDTIIEIAVLVTDGDLRQVVEGPNIAIYHPESVLAGMNAWCQEHHAKSGLVDRVRASSVGLAEAEAAVLAFVAEHTEFGAAQLAGNSVHVDRAFLQRHMPALLAHLHYRIIDVSSIKECTRRWRPSVSRKAPRKVGAHTALSDIKESLRELQYYKAALWRGK
ncbi:Rexo2 [Scenedesmus sp. PABB004]|nr:Rexo2 [Scenedesmus sp. PABB004]